MIGYLYDTPDVSDLIGHEMVMIGYLDDTSGVSDHVGLGIVRYQNDPIDVMIDRVELYFDFVLRGWYCYGDGMESRRALEWISWLYHS